MSDATKTPQQFQKCDDTAGAEGGVDPSSVLEAAAPDICGEEALFAPRSKAQEDANVGIVEERARAAAAGGKPCLPAGAWVEAAKELVPPPPPAEVTQIKDIFAHAVHGWSIWLDRGAPLEG